jgi:UDP-glucose 4-epimerase
MKRVIVFGGSGFLGLYLCHELINREYDVTIADINEPNEKFNFINCDITSDNDLDKVFSNSFDIVYNLAGFANLERANKDPLKTMHLNVIGNLKIIERCREFNVDRYIYASSAYAMSDKGSFYGISKLASEKIIEEYEKNFSLPFNIIRYGSVYSERDFDNNYIYSLIKEAITNQEIVHYGDGEEIREYIHAADAAKLSVDILESEEYKNKHIILTGTQRVRRIELFNMISEILGQKINVKLKNTKNSGHYKYTPFSFQPSISQKLIPNPQIDLGQGLLECIRDVYQKN